MDIIETKERAGLGSPKARLDRFLDCIPASVYGGKEKESVHFSMDRKTVLKLLSDPSFLNRIHTLSLNGKNQDVIAKKVQLHVVTDSPLHLEFMRVDKESKVNVVIPIHFINEDKSPGIKKGGILNIVLHRIEIICSPDTIPSSFEVDLAGAEIHHTIHLSDLNLAHGIRAAHADRDNVIATIVAPVAADEKS